MRRSDILHSINALDDALRSNHIPEALRSLLTTRGDGKRPSILPQLNAYSILATKFDGATLRLTQIFDLEPLADATKWNDILIPENAAHIHELFSNVGTALDVLPKFIKLLEQKGSAEYLEALPKGQRGKEDVSTVSVILLESEKEFSKPERLIELLQSVSDLYQGLARMLNESPDSLTVLSCDSGSDKSFDFLGNAKVMEQFRELIVSLWDRIVFFGPKRQEAVLDVIVKSLPLLAKVSEMEKSDHLGPELAEIIRRQIDGGIRKFVHAGAIIPEIRDHTYHEPRALMSPEKKLLMPPPSGDTPLSPPPVELTKGGNADPDVMKEMLARLERMEQQANAAKEPRPVKRRTKKST